MSVVVIGDRAVGKTSMVVALADSSRSQHVKIVSPDPEDLITKYSDKTSPSSKLAPTSTFGPKIEETLLVNVNLPSGIKQISVEWIDTAGEIWEDKAWRMDYPSAWEGIQKEISQSQGIILLLNPDRELVKPQFQKSSNNPVNTDDLMQPTQWKNNIASWLKFFDQHCRKVKHILICIHKADVFCNVQTEGQNWGYKPSGFSLFYEYNNFVRNHYFKTVNDVIVQYNSQAGGRTLNFFITTIENRSLLELPWIYLGAYLANS